MNKTDPLIAAFRQMAVGKAAPRAGMHITPVGREGDKDKADHFREQLKMVAHATRTTPDAKVEGIADKMELALNAAPGDVEDGGDVTVRSKNQKDRSGRTGEKASRQAAVEVTTAVPDWRGPEAALSAVISRLDHVQSLELPEDDANTRPGHSALRAKLDAMPADAEPAMNMPTREKLIEQRFTLSNEAAPTQTPAAVKVVVREQETHFEPVQPTTLLQKIVDRIATDISGDATQPASTVADVAKTEIGGMGDKPVRMLTLELDPPNLGAVTVKMRMIGDAVEVRLTADRYETSQMLQKDRGALTDAMQSAGYTFDVASIDHTRAADVGPGQSQQQPQSDQRPSQQSFSGSQFDNAGSGKQTSDTHGGMRQGRQGNEQHAEPAERRQDQNVTGNRNSGAVYL